MEQELQRTLNEILSRIDTREESLSSLKADVQKLQIDLAQISTKLDSAVAHKDKLEDLVLTVNTLKTQFKIVWAGFAFGAVSMGGLIITAIFSGLVL